MVAVAGRLRLVAVEVGAVSKTFQILYSVADADDIAMLAFDVNEFSDPRVHRNSGQAWLVSNHTGRFVRACRYLMKSLPKPD